MPRVRETLLSISSIPRKNPTITYAQPAARVMKQTV